MTSFTLGVFYIMELLVLFYTLGCFFAKFIYFLIYYLYINSFDFPWINTFSYSSKSFNIWGPVFWFSLMGSTKLEGNEQISFFSLYLMFLRRPWVLRIPVTLILSIPFFFIYHLKIFNNNIRKRYVHVARKQPEWPDSECHDHLADVLVRSFATSALCRAW